ncbi:NHLP family bacteriocin export ABC transporter peptidase/permease/ATPase subunit [Bacillus sp. Marseille-P3661]|uniref:NHLP family bacteriocin export ABC transporter peptidase/permease/ATPase subunit n=1 Tax=Bacillus sp. Marseille-P3661 TaxID=1936234 RepID=UPI0015E1B706|nr:NHLP family bacteriocin export ABC transporter peptidase/permease/ATPase subunit [Bacillus sp. Marseille-P3661]
MKRGVGLFRKRIKTPTLLQMEAIECGAVSLGIILSYYGRFEPLETLRVACGVSRDGSKASNILKAARNYGLEAKGYKKEVDSLRKVKPPFIIHWNFNHFLVVEHFGKGKVYLNDPATGPTVVTEEEFDRSFTGVVITMEPGEHFERGGQPFSIFRALRKRIAGNELEFVYLLLAGLALALLGVLVPIFLKIYIDRMLLAGQLEWLTAMLIGMAVVIALRMTLTGLRENVLLRLETKLSLYMSGTFIWHILQLPIHFFAHRFSGELARRVQLNDRVASFLTSRLAGTMIDLLLVLFYLVFMFSYHVLLASTVMCFAALNIAYLLYVSRKRSDQNQILQSDSGKFAGVSVAGMMNMETLKANGREADFFSKWAGYQANLVNSEQQARLSAQYLSAVPILLELLNKTILLVFGGYLVWNGYFTVGMLLAFIAFAEGFLQPIKELVSMGSELQEMRGDLVRLDDVLVHPTHSNENIKEIPLRLNRLSQSYYPKKLTGRLEVKDVVFGYSPLEPPLLSGLSFHLEPGKSIAIVGGSGSGKSTVAKVVAGLCKPKTGKVLFDGNDRSLIPSSVLAHSVALVDQNIRLFEGTVWDNLSLWDATIPEEVLVKAAKDSCIHDTITAKMNGYDHHVEEGGRNFSGGQAQRIEIARALAQQPSLLILDEATSALDPLVESEIYHNIRRRGCACLIIAHRLSAIRDCDQIIVLEHGHIVQQGTHSELSRVEGPYKRLFDASSERQGIL